MSRYVLLIVLLVIPTLSVFAQEPDIETMTIYYESEYPNLLDHFLLSKNVCLERIIQVNPDLNILYVEYGQKIIIPTDEHCYNPDEQRNWVNTPSRLKYYENGKWLDEPYYSNNITYGRYSSLEDIADTNNVCIEDLLNDNILLQDFETYTEFADYTSMDIFIPQGEPSCDLRPKPQETEYKLIIINTTYQRIFASYFAEEFNICAEEVAKSTSLIYIEGNKDVNFHVSLDTQPCYNEDGKRLIYYDEQGEKLDAPIYSDLQVYISQPGDTMSGIAEKFDVCLVDLLRQNGFLNLSNSLYVEVFIPPSRPCQTDITATQTKSRTTEDISHELNICKDVLLELNPQLRHYIGDPGVRIEPYNRLNDNANNINQWVIVPTNPRPCYSIYEAIAGETIYTIEQKFNVCYEEFSYNRGYGFMLRVSIMEGIIVYIPLNAPSCYNNLGQRLYYWSESQSNAPYYADMQIYFVKPGDTAYSISQQFNVCIKELHNINPTNLALKGQPVFIPNTRPCYDESTRMPLIYEDDNGQLLDKPTISKRLVHYGNAPLGQLSVYYNICTNRIEDANRAKLDGEASYLGWIIPTDRPPCYDPDWNPIDYVCYTQPIDMSIDYHHVDDWVISFDYNGTHCYDLADPETIVWHENEPYQVINYHGNLLKSRAFTAWCYGVSQDEIDAINANDDVLAILPPYSRLIPQPTRDCYLDHPEILEKASTVHIVQSGETVSDIAKQYDMPYQLIAFANDLDSDDTIWDGQKLIIPDGFTWRGLIAFGGSISAIGLLIILLYRRNHRTYRKKKGIPKNDSTHQHI